MARTRFKTGEYNLRVVILRRVLGAPGPNNEPAETWPDPDVPAEAAAAKTAGAKAYYAARERLGGNEVVAQAIRQSAGSMRIRIKGRAIPVEAVDRVRVVSTGKVYHVTAEPTRDMAETVLDLEVVIPREVVSS